MRCTAQGVTFILQDFSLGRFVRTQVEGVELPFPRPPACPPGWRWLWPGEPIPAGAQAWDWRDDTFQDLVSSVGSPVPADPLHIALWWVPVRAPSTAGLVS